MTKRDKIGPVKGIGIKVIPRNDLDEPFIPINVKEPNSPILEKLEVIDKKLDRLAIIESHLLDILIPQRKQFMKTGK